MSVKHCEGNLTKTNCKGTYYEAFSKLNQDMAELSSKTYEDAYGSFDEGDITYRVRIGSVKGVQLSILALAYQALSCEEIPSSTCRAYSEFVTSSALHFFQMFLLGVYDPLYPVEDPLGGEDSENLATVQGSINVLISLLSSLYDTEFQRLGVGCSIITGDVQLMKSKLSKEKAVVVAPQLFMTSRSSQ